MSKVRRQAVKFTGKRTGAPFYNVPRLGWLYQGKTYLVDLALAERWSEPQATGELDDGGGPILLSDFDLSGKPIEMSEEDAAEYDNKTYRKGFVDPTAPDEPEPAAEAAPEEKGDNKTTDKEA